MLADAAGSAQIGTSAEVLGLWKLHLGCAEDAPAASWILLRQLLACQLNCAPGQISFGRERCPRCGSARGRPVLVSPQAGLHFSLARSGALVVVAIASAPVGVDVEAVAGSETVDEVSPLLHPSEQREIAQAPDRREAFTRVWTRKEAYLKALGTGIVHGLAERASASWAILDVPVDDGYRAAVAVKG